MRFDEESKPIESFSKTYFDDFNPQKNFAAIIVCSAADKSCPYIKNTDKRFYIPFEDPKKTDNTPFEESVYNKSNEHIATEMLFLFSKIK